MDARPVDPSGARHEITALLVELREGRRDAMDRLVPLVYHELRRIAHGQLSVELRDADGHRLYLESWLWPADVRTHFVEASTRSGDS